MPKISDCWHSRDLRSACMGYGPSERHTECLGPPVGRSCVPQQSTVTLDGTTNANSTGVSLDSDVQIGFDLLQTSLIPKALIYSCKLLQLHLLRLAREFEVSFQRVCARSSFARCCYTEFFLKRILTACLAHGRRK